MSRKDLSILSLSCLAALWSGAVRISSLGCTLGNPGLEQNQLSSLLKVAIGFLVKHVIVSQSNDNQVQM